MRLMCPCEFAVGSARLAGRGRRLPKRGLRAQADKGCVCVCWCGSAALEWNQEHGRRRAYARGGSLRVCRRGVMPWSLGIGVHGPSPVETGCCCRRVRAEKCSAKIGMTILAKGAGWRGGVVIYFVRERAAAPLASATAPVHQLTCTKSHCHLHQVTSPAARALRDCLASLLWRDLRDSDDGPLLSRASL